MCDYYDEPSYYEHGIADEILIEFQQKMKDALLENVKLEIENIKEENTRLKEENKNIKDIMRSIEDRERTLEYKEKDIDSRITREFYNKRFSEIFSPYEDKMILWIAEDKSYLYKKCNLCDGKRKITYTAPDQSTIQKDCKCKKYYSLYTPTKTNITVINLYKSKQYDNKFVVTPKYESSERYDKEYSKLKINYVFETFNPNEVEDIELEYECYIGFKSKEECKKYCEWLNKNKEKDSESEELGNYDD